VLLLLKLLVVPGLVAGVTLATRRWGHRIGGLLTAFPVVAGPVLCFYAVEQGHAFAARAAQSTVVGAVAIEAFCIGYARSCRRFPWAVCLAIGWSAFGLVTALAYELQPGLYVGLLVTLLVTVLAAGVTSTAQQRRLPW
jgi:hypothetical protein